MKGAAVVAREQALLNEATERLVVLSTERHEVIDWAVLEQVDELAWGE